MKTIDWSYLRNFFQTEYKKQTKITEEEEFDILRIQMLF